MRRAWETAARESNAEIINVQGIDEEERHQLLGDPSGEREDQTLLTFFLSHVTHTDKVKWLFFFFFS
jgi:hypothetical protein